MAMLLDKIKDVIKKVSALKEAFNNFALEVDISGLRTRKGLEVNQLNKPVASNLQPVRETAGAVVTAFCLTLQRDAVAISFNGQSDFYKWRNPKSSH